MGLSLCQVYLRSPGQVFLILKIQKGYMSFGLRLVQVYDGSGQVSSGNAQAQPRIVAEVFHCSGACVWVHC